jgi:hypothetical protein
MWWIIVIGGVLSVFIYLLFAPIFIEVNSISNLARIKFHQWLSATLIFNDQTVLLDLWIAGWRKQVDLLATNTRERKSKSVMKPDKKKVKTRKRSFPVSLFVAILRSFRIKKFFLTIDTGEVQLNGMLYPFFLYLGRKHNQNMSINFLNDNILILQIENKIARILWATIRTTLLKSKYNE